MAPFRSALPAISLALINGPQKLVDYPHQPVLAQQNHELRANKVSGFELRTSSDARLKAWLLIHPKDRLRLDIDRALRDLDQKPKRTTRLAKRSGQLNANVSEPNNCNSHTNEGFVWSCDPIIEP
ncbi:MAG: hypothetical protein CM1200mP41_24080 [Gammaproteobacteria bacterium]|nr:MAG: hypothetical protein CM1200mP41_24080 [Gammaproteobacteria bacterium]